MKTNLSGIYKITSPTGKIYIGQAKNIAYRIRIYRTYHCKKQIKLYASLIKYGWENHIFEIIHYCEPNMLNDLEIAYISVYNTCNTKHGLNLRTGGNSNIPSESVRKKISNSKKGSIVSNETKEKIRKTLTGYKHSEEAKLNMSKFQKGRKKSIEHRIAISKSHKGKIITREQRLKISNALKGKKHFLYGKKLSKAWKNNISISSIGKKKSKSHVQNIIDSHSKAVVQLTINGEFIKEWKSAMVVQNNIGIWQAAISACCLNKPKHITAGGYKWVFKKDYNEKYNNT